MHCNQVTHLIDDYLDGALDAGTRDILVHHVDSCAYCQGKLSAVVELKIALRDMPIAPASENFASRAIEIAAGRGVSKPQRQPGFMHWFGAGFTGALVAGLVLLGVIVIFQPSQTQQPAATFSIALHQSRNISLAFNAPNDVSDVVVSIELPEQFEVAGHEGSRNLTWKTNLKKGRNILTLPVVARSQGDGTMVARLSRNRQVKTLRILLATDKPELSQYRITSETAV